ncbi:MAG TPA: hypothetical protein VFU05_05195 [Cyclobacteriaceae bacterium]|nr:hypothetical protein [Cyclobacteriaceae bacterium]
MKWTITLVLSFAFCLANSQSLVGTWQLTKQANCLESEVSDTIKTDSDMMAEFSSKSNRSPKVMIFRSDNTGEENIRTMDKKKNAQVKKFLYKYDGTTIYLLDKKSRLITGSLIVDELTSDSLVYHTAGKVCEQVMLVRTQ